MKRKLGMSLKCFLLFSILFWVSSPTFSAIYKWEDANHEVHYSETPPDNANATLVTPETKPSSSATQEKARFEKLEAQFNKEKEQALKDKEKSQKSTEEANLKATNCKGARAQLADLESKPRVKLLDASGNATMLTQEQRNAEIEKTKAVIKENCPP